jgi:nicotinamidase-related amidase
MSSALIVVDMLNTYEHPDAERLMESVRTVVPVLASALDQARDSGVPIVYVNDNYSEWTYGRRELIDSAMHGAAPELVEPIIPADDAPFVIKARHSIFYGTIAEYLLRAEGIDRLILTGQVTEQCILYSALDAYVRHFEVAVAADAVAHIFSDLGDAALRMMERNMRATVAPAQELIERAQAA